MLANGSAGADLDQQSRRADEHGGALAPEKRLRTRRRRLPGWTQPMRSLLRGQRMHRAGHTARRGRRIPGSQDRATPPTPAHREHGEVFLKFLCLKKKLVLPTD